MKRSFDRRIVYFLQYNKNKIRNMLDYLSAFFLFFFVLNLKNLNWKLYDYKKLSKFKKKNFLKELFQ